MDTFTQFFNLVVNLSIDHIFQKVKLYYCSCITLFVVRMCLLLVCKIKSNFFRHVEEKLSGIEGRKGKQMLKSKHPSLVS